MTEIDEIFSDSERIEIDGDSASKREFLINLIQGGKVDKLPGKTPWTIKRIQKASDSVIEKLYHEYHQNDLKHKSEMTGKAVGSHVVNLYSQNISKVLKIDSVQQLRADIDKDPIIKESMAEVGALLVRVFGPYLSPLLVVAHTLNHTAGVGIVSAETAADTLEEEEEKSASVEIND